MFALFKCSTEFTKDVCPIPLADLYPTRGATVSNYGCPRCGWPSLQVLSLNRTGSRIVGLLTWGGSGEGLGQSTPFLLQAMKGRLPKSLDSLPRGAREVADKQEKYHVATWPTQPLDVSAFEMKIGLFPSRSRHLTSSIYLPV